VTGSIADFSAGRINNRGGSLTLISIVSGNVPGDCVGCL
jgi:hypothetical protein